MENQRELFVKWMKYLFYVQIAAGVAGLISAVPVLDVIVLWVSRALSIATVVVLLKMAPLNARYKKAAIFSCVGFALAILTTLTDIAALVLAVSICSLVGTYQEYCGHSEMVETMDAKLAKNWHSLFNWQIFSGIIVGVLGGVLVVVSVIAFPVSQEVLTSITLVLTNGVDLIILIIYLILLKRTYTMYEECEKIEMNDSYE